MIWYPLVEKRRISSPTIAAPGCSVHAVYCSLSEVGVRYWWMMLQYDGPGAVNNPEVAKSEMAAMVGQRRATRTELPHLGHPSSQEGQLQSLAG